MGNQQELLIRMYFASWIWLRPDDRQSGSDHPVINPPDCTCCLRDTLPIERSRETQQGRTLKPARVIFCRFPGTVSHLTRRRLGSMPRRMEPLPLETGRLGRKAQPIQTTNESRRERAEKALRNGGNSGFWSRKRPATHAREFGVETAAKASQAEPNRVY